MNKQTLNVKQDLYLVCTDLCSMGVGPFKSLEEINEHRKFLEERGDADADGVVITEDQLDDVEYLELDIITPEEDRAETFD